MNRRLAHRLALAIADLYEDGLERGQPPVDIVKEVAGHAAVVLSGLSAHDLLQAAVARQAGGED